MRNQTIDKPFLFIVLGLVVVGFFIFSSASLGLLAREDGATFSTVAIKQLLIGIGMGLTALFVTTRINYKLYRKYALPLIIFAILLTAAVFIPHVGTEHGGATRWLNIGPFSFQPAEVLKISFVIYLAAWISAVKDRINTFRYGLLPFGIAMAVIGGILLKQPDTGSFLIIVAAGIGMLFIGGMNWRNMLILFLVGMIGCGAIAYFKPYVMSRVTTFLHPGDDPQGQGYQIKQSLIAVGSGEIFGRGFGQSVQKFQYLPEPVSDSIFAVFAEEFGFVGAFILITLFVVFAFRGFRISTRAPDMFGGLLASGIVILLISQSFLNIGSVLGVLPFTGEPLAFVSQGGTAMLIALAEVGIILNISKYQR